MPPERYDLHTHSIHSDGLLAPREIIALAVDRGLSGVAITDHDSVEGISQGVAAAQALGIECIPAIELSCSSESAHVVHLLGYFIRPGSPELAAAVGRIQEARSQRAERMVGRLRELGVKISYSQVEAHAGSAIPTRSHIARAMVDAGAISEPALAFSKDWIAPGGRAWVSVDLLPVGEGVTAIHAAGGAAVFAHPGIDAPSGEILIDAVREAAAAGLDGIEVDHPDHDDGALRASVDAAIALGLVQTAGSDDHGVGMDGPRLGCRTVPGRVVQQLADAARRHRA